MTVVWTALGLGLCAAELLTGTFVLLFFGFSAFIVALARLLGLDSLTYEILLFAVSGFASLLLFRGKLISALDRGDGREIKNDQDAVIVLSEAVPGHGDARISYQGSLWTAVNESALTLEKGQKAVIYKTEGVRLFVRALEK